MQQKKLLAELVRQIDGKVELLEIGLEGLVRRVDRIEDRLREALEKAKARV